MTLEKRSPPYRLVSSTAIRFSILAPVKRALLLSTRFNLPQRNRAGLSVAVCIALMGLSPSFHQDDHFNLIFQKATVGLVLPSTATSCAVTLQKAECF